MDAAGLPGPPGPPERIAAGRVRLVQVTPADRDDLLAGRRQDRWHPQYPREDDLDGVRMMREPGPWDPRHVVVDLQAVGSLGFFGPPEDAGADGCPEVEVGYGLVEAARGRGIATEALRAMLAETDLLGVRVRARVEPVNRASLRVLAKVGFTELRGADDDGHLVMARPLPRDVPSRPA